jgi:hypothetical protein
MAWFLNHCGARDMTPHASEDLTTIIERVDLKYKVLWSPETAEHDPDYRELGIFSTEREALNFLSKD